MFRRWKEYQGVPNKFRKDNPHVTLSAKGVILMNMIAFDKMGGPASVTLLYDPASSVIGLKPTEPTAANAFPVKGKDNFRTRVIHAKPFVRHFNIETDRTIAFLTPEIDRDGVMLLDLSATTTVGRADSRR